MILSFTLTSHWVVGLKLDEEKSDYNYETFKFPLPFAKFRDAKTKYLEEVIQKVFDITKTSRKDATLIVVTEDELMLKSKLCENSYRITESLSQVKLPLVYVGEAKGFIDGIVYPLVINPSDFYRWFNLADDINQVENYFYNRRIYSFHSPINNWEKGFEEALFREKLSFLFDNMQTGFLEKTNDIVISGDGLINSGDDKKTVLSFLDAVSLPGFWRIYMDPANTLINIQAIKQLDASLGEAVYGKFKLKDLAGCLVIPNATEIDLKFPEGDNLKVSLESDSISVIPLDKETKVEVKATGNDKKSEYFKCSGGAFGLVVDNRLRPLLKDKDSKERLNSIEKWEKEINSTVNFNKSEKDLPKNSETEPEDIKKQQQPVLRIKEYDFSKEVSKNKDIKKPGSTPIDIKKVESINLLGAPKPKTEVKKEVEPNFESKSASKVKPEQKKEVLPKQEKSDMNKVANTSKSDDAITDVSVSPGIGLDDIESAKSLQTSKPEPKIEKSMDVEKEANKVSKPVDRENDITVGFNEKEAGK